MEKERGVGMEKEVEMEKLEVILRLIKGMKRYEWDKVSHCINKYFDEKATKVEAGDDFVEVVKHDYERNFIQ